MAYTIGMLGCFTNSAWLRPTSALAVLTVLVSLTPPAYALSPADEITALLQAVESSDCTFVRNGERHSASEAADHLRLKYRRGKRYAPTAEAFIERLASKSSWSGKPYSIECGGVSRASGDWLGEQLQIIRKKGTGDQ